MINGKFIFFTRTVFVLIMAGLFIIFIWYQNNKSTPEFIEARENFLIDYVYSAEGGYLDDNALKSTAESLSEIFRLPAIERDATMISIEAGNRHNIVFIYQYAVKIDTASEKKRINEYTQFQKLRFCGNPLDRKRMKLTDGYDFIYYLGREEVIRFTIRDSDC